MQDEQNKESVFVGLFATALQYHACVVCVHGNNVSVLKNYAVSKDETGWGDFVKKIELDFPDYNVVMAMSFEDSCAGFYHFEVPVVSEKQISLIVRSQAEIHLPLPVEQMQYSWQMLSEKENKALVSVVAAKRDILSDIAATAKQLNVDAVVLSSEAYLKAVAFLSEIQEDEFALIYVHENKVKLIFVQQGILARGTTFDCDFSIPSDGQTPEISLLCLDIQHVIEKYLSRGGDQIKLFLDGEGEFVSLLFNMLSNNKSVEVSRIHHDFDRIVCNEDSAINMECLGSALIASESNVKYDLFDGLYRKVDLKRKNIQPKKKKKILGAVACLMLCVLIAVSYGVDKLRLAAYKKQMNTPEFSQLLETYQLRNLIAQERIDVVEIIQKINQSIPKDVKINSLLVRRFQRIDVGGSCKDPKMVYDFVQALTKCKGVGVVRVSNQKRDDKNKQINFSVTFDYKNFTNKRKTFK